MNLYESMESNPSSGFGGPPSQGKRRKNPSWAPHRGFDFNEATAAEMEYACTTVNGQSPAPFGYPPPVSGYDGSYGYQQLAEEPLGLHIALIVAGCFPNPASMFVINGAHGLIHLLDGDNLQGATYIVGGVIPLLGKTPKAGLGGAKVVPKCGKPGPVLSGHGAYFEGSGAFFVPEGTSITVFTRRGNPISNRLGNAIETGVEITPDLFPVGLDGAQTHLPGSLMWDYTLQPPGNLIIYGNPVTVTGDTRLSQLVGPGMGNVKWAACQKVKAPTP